MRTWLACTRPRLHSSWPTALLLDSRKWPEEPSSMYDFLLQLVDMFRTALRMRTPEELEREVGERKKAEKALKRANDELERRVWERTAQLARTNATLKKSEERLQHDVTARKQTEEALRHSEEQFRRAIVDAPIPIIMHAEDGEILQIS